jgi:hypothetical protein
VGGAVVGVAVDAVVVEAADAPGKRGLWPAI